MEKDAEGSSRSLTPSGAEQGRNKGETSRKTSAVNGNNRQKKVTGVGSQAPTAPLNTSAVNNDESSAATESLHTQLSGEPEKGEQPVPVDGGSIKGRLRRKLEKSTSQTGYATVTKENKEEASLGRLTSRVEQVSKFIMGKKGRGIHLPIQEAIEAIKLELHVLKGIRRCRAVVPHPEEELVTGSDKSPPAKKLRADKCQNQDHSMEEEGDSPGLGVSKQVVSALAKMQEVLQEQWKVIEGLSAQNRIMQAQLQRHLSPMDPAEQRVDSVEAPPLLQAKHPLAPVAVASEGDTWNTVASKKTRRDAKNVMAVKETTKGRTEAIRKLGNKPPAILVKSAVGKSYADTVRALRSTSGISPEKVGAKVKVVRMTREGHVLLELTQGAASHAAATKLKDEIVAKLGSNVGAVTQLGQVVEVEVVDIDAAADREEVLSALQAAVPGGDDDLAVISERRAIEVTGLWATRSGHQVATAKMSRAAASCIDRVAIGWTMCRVRERRPPPVECYRCHGYGHYSTNCKGPDLFNACRRCGETGHTEKGCKAGEDRCVACERAGKGRKVHRPGSGACEARKEAAAKGMARKQLQKND